MNYITYLYKLCYTHTHTYNGKREEQMGDIGFSRNGEISLRLRKQDVKLIKISTLYMHIIFISRK